MKATTAMIEMANVGIAIDPVAEPLLLLPTTRGAEEANDGDEEGSNDG